MNTQTIAPLETTKENLFLSIQKLKILKEELVMQKQEDSNEFVMLMEVMLQCSLYLLIITGVCKKGFAYLLENKSDVDELDRQANEYVNLVLQA